MTPESCVARTQPHPTSLLDDHLLSRRSTVPDPSCESVGKGKGVKIESSVDGRVVQE